MKIVNLKKLLSLILLISYGVRAETIYLDKGQIALFSGYLLPPEDEKRGRLSLMEVDFQKAINESKTRELESSKKEVGYLNEQLVLYKSSNEQLFKRSMENTIKGFGSGFWHFLLGAVVTIAITYSVNHK